MYTPFITNLAKKDFKKLDTGVQKLIYQSCIQKILKDPGIGERLRGKDFEGLSKFKLSLNSVDYRIVYKIEKKELVIIFIMFGSRENFYKKLKKRV